MDRPGHPNDTLFFWAFEKERGSLTESARANDSGEGEGEPWGIWLNGGSVLVIMHNAFGMGLTDAFGMRQAGYVELARDAFRGEDSFCAYGVSSEPCTGC